MTADGATHVVLLVIAVVVVLYLCAALIFPERF
ncbi:K(+)-transporting ATPase subunit F [Williamsia muralis]